VPLAGEGKSADSSGVGSAVPLAGEGEEKLRIQTVWAPRWPSRERKICGFKLWSRDPLHASETQGCPDRPTKSLPIRGGHGPGSLSIAEIVLNRHVSVAVSGGDESSRVGASPAAVRERRRAISNPHISAPAGLSPGISPMNISFAMRNLWRRRPKTRHARAGAKAALSSDAAHVGRAAAGGGTEAFD
jgi:hypothetical protein